MSRRNSLFGTLLEHFFELTGYFWQVGIAISALFMLLAYITYGWVSTLVANIHDNPLLEALETTAFFLYSIPLMSVAVSMFFAVKTYSTYHKRNSL